jgi:p-aminobenzoyl-glutamate transporter AbgT
MRAILSFDMDASIWIIMFLTIGGLAYYCYASGEIKTQRQIIKDLEAKIAELSNKTRS